MRKRFAIPVIFIAEAETVAEARQVLKDHLNITLAGDYEDLGEPMELKETAETSMFPITSGVVPVHPLPRRPLPLEIVADNFEGSRFYHGDEPFDNLT